MKWDRALLSAIGITAPVSIALIIWPHAPAAIGAGSLASMGTLVASATDLAAAEIARVRQMAPASVMAAIGFLVGTLVYCHDVLTLVVVSSSRNSPCRSRAGSKAPRDGEGARCTRRIPQPRLR